MASANIVRNGCNGAAVGLWVVAPVVRMVVGIVGPLPVLGSRESTLDWQQYVLFSRG